MLMQFSCSAGSSLFESPVNSHQKSLHFPIVSTKVGCLQWWSPKQKGPNSGWFWDLSHVRKVFCYDLSDRYSRKAMDFSPAFFLGYLSCLSKEMYVALCGFPSIKFSFFQWMASGYPPDSSNLIRRWHSWKTCVKFCSRPKSWGDLFFQVVVMSFLGR